MEHRIILKIESAGSKAENIEDFKKSYYASEYAHAFQVVKKIIAQQMNTRNRIHRERHDSEIFNIVPFIGGRGTGKTTAMCSFAKALEKYYAYLKIGKEKYYYDYLLADDDKFYKCQFTCLEPVDGSLLEQGENIFNIILAQMYNLFLELDKHGTEENNYYGYEKRELQQSFDEVYRSMCKIEKGGKTEEESYITSLINLSSSLAIKKAFKSLVAQFLKMVRNDKYDERNYGQDYEHFLVITIDDLDLNINAGFEMLELIHRYMMVPQVIILLAVDYEQLQLLCDKHFYKAIPQVDKILVQREKDIDKLSQDFINKVLPFDARIYMPSFSKYKDSFGGIVIKRDDKETDIKKAIFQEIYRKIGMRLDTVGQKRHFYEAENIREFVNLYSMVENIRDLPKNNEDKVNGLELYRNNYSVFISDVCHRMVYNRLDKQRREIFGRLKDEPVARACRRFLDEVMDLANGEALVEDIKKYGYSYGEILRSIYCVGRINFGNKQLIRCLLAYFSIEMTHVYYKYKFSDDKIKSIIFKEILNGSFGGSWSNMIMPEVIRLDTHGFESAIIKTGAVCDVVMKEAFSFDIPIPDFNKEDDMHGNEQEWMKRVFKSMIIFGMFFSEPYHNNPERHHWAFHIDTKEPEREWLAAESLANPDLKNKHLEITFSGSSRKTFNVFNFVSNVFEWKDVVKRIEKALYDGLKNGENNQWIFALLGQNISEDKFLEYLGIDKAFQMWERVSGGFVLPVYDMDLTYNIVKRIRLQRIWNRREKVTWKWNELWGYYEKLLHMIREKLAENDEYYETVNFENLEILYITCPIIEWIEHKDYNLVDGLPELFENMMRNIISVGKTETGAVETEISSFED